MSEQTNQMTAPRPKAISTAIEDFDVLLGRANAYEERLRKLLDRINGPQPELVGKPTQGETLPHSLIASIHERRGRLIAILDRMEHSIGGLENSV